MPQCSQGYWSKVVSATILYATILTSHTGRKYYLRPYSMPKYSPVLRSSKVLSATILYAKILASVAVIESIIRDHTLCQNTRQCCGHRKYYPRPYSMPKYSPVLRSSKVLSATILYATILASVAVIESIIWDHSLCHNTRQCCGHWKYYLRSYSMPQYSRMLRSSKVLSGTIVYATILANVAVVKNIIWDHTLCHNTRECYRSKVLSVTILYATILASVTSQKYYLRPYSMPQYSPVLPFKSIICDHTLCHNTCRSKVLYATILYAPVCPGATGLKYYLRPYFMPEGLWGFCKTLC
jgi:uncharacterized protein (UPF0147 family)